MRAPEEEPVANEMEMAKQNSSNSSSTIVLEQQAMSPTPPPAIDSPLCGTPKEHPTSTATNCNPAIPINSNQIAINSAHLNRLLLHTPPSPKSRFAPKTDAPERQPSMKKRTSLSSSSSSSRPPSPKTPATPNSQPDAANFHRRNSEKYVLFRTRSSKIERQLSRLRDEDLLIQQQQEHHPNYEPPVDDPSIAIHLEDHSSQVPAGRFFDALQGPELEQLRASEEALLPLDQQWPFLLRFPISSFGVALGLGSQSILWKNLATVPAVAFLHASHIATTVLWFLAAAALAAISVTYVLKSALYFEAVRREYYHPVRVNFFFAPWIAAMFLAMGLPRWVDLALRPWIWCCLMAPILALELKIYGQWLSGGQRRLSKVANPSTHLSVAGNFVGAMLGASVGWIEGAIFFWAIGLAHYMVLFVTLYQRLPTNEALPKELHPVFFLFVAAPSAASLAWEKITGNFGFVSRIAFFIALFLFTSLVVRINFFRGFRFSLAWWAYTFPMTAIAIASIHYCQEVTTPITQALAVLLSAVSTVTVALLFLATACHWLVWKTLFPNDLAIAITNRRRKKKNRKGFTSGSDDLSSSGGTTTTSTSTTTSGGDSGSKIESRGWSCINIPCVELFETKAVI